MRRADLKVGMHVLVNNRHNWQHWEMSAKHWVVASLDPYVWMRGEALLAKSHQKRTGVLVHAPGHPELLDVVEAGHIRGEWDETSAAIEARNKALKEQQAADVRRRNEITARKLAVQTALAEHDIYSVSSATPGYLSLSLTDVEAILAVLPEGWKLPHPHKEARRGA